MTRRLHDKILQSASTVTSFEQVAMDCMQATAVKFQRARESYNRYLLAMAIAVRDKRVRDVKAALNLPDLMDAKGISGGAARTENHNEDHAGDLPTHSDDGVVVHGDLSPEESPSSHATRIGRQETALSPGSSAACNQTECLTPGEDAFPLKC